MNEQETIIEIRNLLEKAQNPLFIIDDDPDGVCAYLVLKKYINKGNFLLVKSAPVISEEFLSYAAKHNPDLIIILDIANVSEEFLHGNNVPIVWIDHHEPRKTNATYYNPRNYDDSVYVPTSECAYNIVQNYQWLAGIGIMEDWKIPPFMDNLLKDYPDLVHPTDSPGYLRFETPYGKIGMMVRAALKGSVNDSNDIIKLLEQVESPYDFEKYPEKYKPILKKYYTMKEELDCLLTYAEEGGEHNEHFIIFTYHHTGQYALTGLIAEILNYRHPGKLVLVAREKDGVYRLAARASKGDINSALQSAFKGTSGRGGGHYLSCGGSIDEKEFDTFIAQFKQEWLTQIEQLK